MACRETVPQKFACAGYLGHPFVKLACCIRWNKLPCRRHVRCEYNQRGPCCLYSLATRLFHEGEILFVLCVFISIKRRVCFSFHALQERFSRWIKPPTTSLLLGTLTDMTRGKSELLAENALLRQQLIILRRQVKRPVYRKDGPASPGASGQDGPDLETGSLPCPTGDATSLAS